MWSMTLFRSESYLSSLPRCDQFVTHLARSLAPLMRDLSFDDCNESEARDKIKKFAPNLKVVTYHGKTKVSAIKAIRQDTPDVILTTSTMSMYQHGGYQHTATGYYGTVLWDHDNSVLPRSCLYTVAANTFSR